MFGSGFNMPPGCYSTPYDEPCFCDVCGLSVDDDDCICPECPVCGEIGNPECYAGSKKWWNDYFRKRHQDRTSWFRFFFGHGLIRLPRQKKSLAHVEAQLEADCRAEAEMFARMEEENEF